MSALKPRLRAVSGPQYWRRVLRAAIRYTQYSKLMAQPVVNRTAQTVLPDDAGGTPSFSAAAMTLLPKAAPRLGRQDRMPASTAIISPEANAFEGDWVEAVAGDRREPPTEHSTMPTSTSAVPASRIKPLVV